jgi:hypothetical protein
MIILEADLEDSVVRSHLDRMAADVAKGGATLERTYLFDSSAKLLPVQPTQQSGFQSGRRRLAYEIKHKSEGIYVVLEILGQGDSLDELDRQLRLADDVIRHKIFRLPDDEAERRGLLGTATPANAG